MFFCVSCVFLVFSCVFLCFPTTALVWFSVASSTPPQNLAADWSLGSKGCYDAVSLTRLQAALQYDIQSVATGNIEGCLTIRLGNSAEQALVDETLRADAKALGLLMADHTQLDWRPLLPRITIPCLNLVGGVSGVFPVEGVKEVGRLVKHCHTVRRGLTRIRVCVVC